MTNPSAFVVLLVVLLNFTLNGCHPTGTGTEAAPTPTAPSEGLFLAKLAEILSELERAYEHSSLVVDVESEDMSLVVEEIRRWDAQFVQQIQRELPFLASLVAAIKQVVVESSSCQDDKCIQAIGASYCESRPAEVEDFDAHDMSQTATFKLSSALKNGNAEISPQLYRLGMDEFTSQEEQSIDLEDKSMSLAEFMGELTRIERLVDYMHQFSFLKYYRY